LVTAQTRTSSNIQVYSEYLNLSKMGVLEDKQNGSTASASTDSSDAGKTKNAPTPTDMSQHKTGYERSLFGDTQPKWNDDRMGTADQMETRYHDKEMVLKVANGLCYDIFFRADDVYRPDFDEIPEFHDPVLEEPKTEHQKKMDRKVGKLINKPLDSKVRERTYILNPDEVEQEKKKPASRPGRGGSGRGSGRRRNSNRNSNRRRGSQGRRGNNQRPAKASK
jgi:hypothetical protein